MRGSYSSRQKMKPLATAPFAAVWLAILMLCGLAALAGLMIWQNYRAVLEAGEARAMSSAQVVAAHLEWMMEASDQALQRIDSALGGTPISSSPAGTISDIRQAVGDLPSGFQYSVYDETGRLRFSSVPEAIGIDVSDRGYFQRLQNGAAIVVSAQLKERLSGERVFVVARAIRREGAFYGAASIAIPTTSMDEFWALLELGPHSTVSVVRTDGWLVARHPQLPEAIDLSKSQLFTRHLPNASSGVYRSAASPADGMARIVAYREVNSWPLIATTGVELGEAMEIFWSSLRAGLIIGLPLIGLLALVIFWIIRLIRADERRRFALEQALERNKFLFREIHHRVKNNLQAVSALVQMQALPSETRAAMARRIAAMVAVHEQIYGADQFESVDAASYATRLVEQVAAGFPSAIRIETEMETFSVEPDQALPLGLILNEALSNSFKHAFAGKQDGLITVRLSKQGGHGCLVIADNGSGSMPGNQKGMGTRLINGFVAQLEGTLQIQRDAGTKLIVTFPLSG